MRLTFKVGITVLLVASIIGLTDSTATSQQKNENGLSRVPRRARKPSRMVLLRRTQRKKKLLRMLDEFERISGNNKKSKSLGQQYGTRLLETTGKRITLKTGKKVFQIECAPSQLLKPKLHSVKSYVWEKKSRYTGKFLPVVGISVTGKLYWADKVDWQRWIKFNNLLTFESAEGKVGTASTSFFKLYIPLGNCEEETGSYRCKMFASERYSGITKLEKYFKFKEGVDPSCSGSSGKAGKILKGNRLVVPKKDGGKLVDGVEVKAGAKEEGGSNSMVLLGVVAAVVVVVGVIILVVFCVWKKKTEQQEDLQELKSKTSVRRVPTARESLVHRVPSARESFVHRVPSARESFVHRVPTARESFVHRVPTARESLVAPEEETMEASYRPGPPEGAPNRGGLFADINKLRIE